MCFIIQGSAAAEQTSRLPSKCFIENFIENKMPSLSIHDFVSVASRLAQLTASKRMIQSVRNAFISLS